MASRNAAIAEDVKTKLNAAAATSAAFGVAFSARRVYVPANALDKLKTLQVTVYAAADNQEQATRKKQLHDIQVQIGLQIRLPDTCDPETEAGNVVIDGYTETAERVADYWGPLEATYGGSLGAQWASTGLLLPDIEHLRTDRVFTAVISLTFKLLA